MKKSSSILIMALFILAVATCIVQGATIVVTPAGAGGDFNDLQSAVNAASPGDVIEIRPGQYPGEIVVDRPLTVAGTGTGCRVGTEDDTTGVEIRSDNVTVRNLVIASSSSGIFMEGTSNTQVDGCHIESMETGIRASLCNGTVIRNSTISSDLIGIETTSSSDVVIEKNRITALSRGISIDGGDGFAIAENRLTACEIGIFSEGLRQSTIRANTFSGNVGGEVFLNAQDCVIEYPVIADVNQFVQFIASSGCVITTESIAGPDYFTADILSDTTYITGPYALTGWNYALSGETYGAPEGYLQFGDALRFTIIEDAQSQTEPFIVMEAEAVVGDLEGYDPETFGFYRIDGSEPVPVGGTPNVRDGLVTTTVTTSAPGSFALLVQTQETGPDLFYVLMGVLGAIALLLIFLVFVWRRD